MNEENPGLPDFSPQPATPIPFYAPPVAPATLNLLARTRPWVLFMSIVGFICVGFMVLAGLGMGAAGVVARKPEMMFGLVFYPLSGLLYFFPALFLYRFSKGIRDLQANPQLQQLDAALDAQRAFWKFAGIVTIIGFVVTVLAILAAIVIGVAAGVRSQRF